MRELLRYEDIQRVHWMFKDLYSRDKLLEADKIKRNHFDRVEIETRNGLAVLEGLDQAYWPALHFLWWISP